MPIMEVVLYQRAAGVEVRNVFHARSEGDVESVRLTIRENLMDKWTLHLLDRLSLQWQMYGVSVRDLETVGAPAIEMLQSTPVVGTNGAEMLPRHVAAIISFKTGTVPPNKSRKYIPGLTEEANQVGGVLGGGAMDDLAALVDDFLTDNEPVAADLNGFVWGVARTHTVNEQGQSVRLGTPLFNAYIGGTVRPMWGSQRDRRS